MAIQPLNKNIPEGRRQRLLIFLFFWALTFVLYLPAYKAGFVGDFPYGLDSFRHNSFLQFVNAEEGVHTLFQFVNIVTWLLFTVFGAHPLLWHIFMVSLHAVNVLLLFNLLKSILTDSGIQKSKPIVFTAMLLFTICPHISEAVVWEPAYHIPFACILLFSVLLLARKYLLTQRAVYAWMAGIIYCASTYATEIFALTPVFILLLVFYYHYVLRSVPATAAKKTVFYCALPAFLFLAFHFVVLRITYHSSVSHFGAIGFGSIYMYLGKILKYLAHIVLLSRYYSGKYRDHVYYLCDKKSVILLLYSVAALIAGIILWRHKRIHIKYKALLLLACLIFLSILPFTTLDFPTLLLLTYDRYTYLADGFIYTFLVLAVSLITYRFIQASIISLYALANLYCTHKLNKLWKQSDEVIQGLLNTFPETGSKTVLLLNLPECLEGVPMIAAQPDGRFKLMKNTLTNRPVGNPVYDVVSYNMSAVNDGAHVTVVNDSMVHVTLNQWGTWWLYAMLGASDYENDAYRVKMVDEGHWYEITLKQPAQQYVLLYQVGSQWKTVNMALKNVDQY